MKYIKNTKNLCHKCLQEKNDIKRYSIYGRGYGSKFDNCNQYLQLCSECRKGIEEDLESQDWIDIELGVASDEIYKKYGMYTPSERKAYHDRFPTCKHTYLKVYSDGSAGTYCSKNIFVHGEKDFTCSQTSKECYYCNEYERKDENFTHKVEKELLIEPRLVQMYEIFCPTCGHKILKYRYELEDGDDLYCDNCLQELVVNIEEDYTY